MSEELKNAEENKIYKDVHKSTLIKDIVKENLNIKYFILYKPENAIFLFKKLENVISYFENDQSKIKIFGKWHKIPRKQVAFGDPGTCYWFSGVAVPAKSWKDIPLILKIKFDVEKALNHTVVFNFVLINRYENGNDYIGEHRDNEKDLHPNMPIASVSFGQSRDFIFKHKNNRGKHKTRPDLKKIEILLESGSLLVMNPPTNEFWYHSLPVRKQIKLPRINLTFRVLK